ncbi:MAG: hypothetical protein JXA82_00825 [Sedimentisphaerales bacterium]|nr:hypothetical protein [Sedimentisphaerales bacterium]
MKICCSRLCIVFGVAGSLFASAYGVSGALGPSARAGCGLAILLVGIAVLFWMVSIQQSRKSAREMIDTVLCGGAWIRLRTMAIGILIIGMLVEQELFWFLGWTGFFYVAILVFESICVVWMMRAYDWKKGFLIDGADETVAGNDLSN